MSHLVVMDSWYTSIPLFNILRAHGTRALGTIRSNRVGFPQDMVEESKNLSSGHPRSAKVDNLWPIPSSIVSPCPFSPLSTRLMTNRNSNGEMLMALKGP